MKEHSEFSLPVEEANLFPEIPDFGATSYHVISAADLKKLIRRTIFATDVETTRYALGGVLVELTAESIAMVGTDGRRLALLRGFYRVEIRDVDTGKELARLPAPRVGTVIAFAPDGRTLATADLDGVIRLWDLRPLDLVSPP